jgi:hypothetical protein
LIIIETYFIFFRQMGWIRGETDSGEWRLTDKGRETLKHLLSGDDDDNDSSTETNMQ